MSRGTRVTISPPYLETQQILHQNPNYGVMSVHYAPTVKELIRVTGARSISDYGAGKKRLQESLLKLGASGFEYFPYDPAFPEYGDPKPGDLSCCIDVLEHIEPKYLDNVLEDLNDITRGVGFFTIHTGAAIKVLPDGRNAHLIQEPSSWWLARLVRYFDIAQLQSVENGFWVVAKRTSKKAKPV